MGTSARKIRVLVVDDSAVVRTMICDYLAGDPDIEVVGQAEDGCQALEIFERVEADVVTLDIQMPKMDGLATLDALLARRPVPVIMVSSLTRRGAEITLDALDRGAMDYVSKPASGAQADTTLGRELLRKIRMVAGLQVGRIIEIRKQRKQHRLLAQSTSVPTIVAEAASGEFADKCIALGISTGGPPALAALFESLCPPCPPVVVVQHMPPQFTQSLAWWLDSRSQLTIREAGNGDMLRPDHVYIAPGGAHLELHGSAQRAALRVFDAPAVSGHKPSVDVMMRSAARVFQAKCLGIIMTGMGHDGVDGCRAIRQAGGFVLGQDEASSDVYGMNKAAYVGGCVDEQFSLAEAAEVVTRTVRKLWLSAVAAIY